jgi:hypothetical protein
MLSWLKAVATSWPGTWTVWDWFHAAVIAQVAPPDKSLQGLVVDILKARQPYGNTDEIQLAGKDADRKNPGR